MLEKSKTYDVVTGKTPVEIVDKVNLLMAEGWEPLGGLVSFIEGKHQKYAQAVIR